MLGSSFGLQNVAGTVFTYKIRLDQRGKRTTRCLEPGETKPQKTCS